jgi:hypothetical protein
MMNGRLWKNVGMTMAVETVALGGNPITVTLFY